MGTTISITLHHLGTTSVAMVSKGAESYKLDVLTKEGYTFIGYYTEEFGGGEKYTDELGNSLAALKNTSDFNLYAHYTHNVTFVTNGGSEISSLQNYPYGKPLPTDLEIPTKDKRKFEGWSTTPGQEKIIGPNDPVTGNVLYAKWKEETPAHFFVYNAQQISSCSYDKDNVLIPTHIGGNPVIYVTMQDNTYVKNIEVPDGIQLDFDSLKGCTNLVSLNVDTVNAYERLGYLFGAQNNVYQSKGSGIPTTFNKITIRNLTNIPDYFFSYCDLLTYVRVSDDCNAIGESAFENCTSLTTIEIPHNVKTISYNAFRGCTSLSEINIPASVTEILGGAFENCTALTSIFIPVTVTFVDYHAFNGCTNLTINCEASSQPSSWDAYWNEAGNKVIWGATKPQQL